MTQKLLKCLYMKLNIQAASKKNIKIFSDKILKPEVRVNVLHTLIVK
jgi:hypothetical protein